MFGKFRFAILGVALLFSGCFFKKNGQETQALPDRFFLWLAPSSVVAGECVAVSFQGQDRTQEFQVTQETNVELQASAGGFYRDRNCAEAVDSIELTPRNSVGMLYYSSRDSGPQILTAQSQDMEGSFELEILPGAATTLQLTARSLMTAGTCELVTLTFRDSFGNVAAPTAGSYMGTPSAGTLYLDRDCRTAGNVITAPTSEIYFRSTTTMLGTLQVNGQGLSAQIGLAVAPGPVARITLDGPTVVVKNVCTAAYTIKSFDAYNNETVVPAGTPVALSGNGLGNFSAVSDCTTSTSTLSFPGINPSIRFYFRDANAENVTLRATLSGVPSAMITVSVVAQSNLEWNQTTFDYGAIPVGAQKSQAFVLRNPSLLPVNTLAFRAAGGVTRAADDCNGRLAANSTCNVTVLAGPDSAGVSPGMFFVDYFDGVANQSKGIAFTGMGNLQPMLDITAFDAGGRPNIILNDIDGTIPVAVDPQRYILGGFATNGTNNDFYLTSNQSPFQFARVDFGGQDYITSVEKQSDGKILAAGYTFDGTSHRGAIARLTPNGALDTTFGSGGKVTLSAGAQSVKHDFIHAVTIANSGAIFAVGYSFNGKNYDLLLAKYSASGVLDTTFGKGGITLSSFSTGNEYATWATPAGEGVAILARLMTDGHYQPALIFYGRNGEAMFGNTYNVDNQSTLPMSLTVDSTQKYLILAKTVKNGVLIPALLRVNSNDLTPDNTFGNGGHVVLELASLAQLPGQTIQESCHRIAEFQDGTLQLNCTSRRLNSTNMKIRRMGTATVSKTGQNVTATLGLGVNDTDFYVGARGIGGDVVFGYNNPASGPETFVVFRY